MWANMSLVHREPLKVLKFLLEHGLPRKLRYAKVYLQAGAASVFFTLDGASADWHASIGRRSKGIKMSDSEYSRLRDALPAVELLDDDGKTVIIRTAAGFEETWQKPAWVLRRVHRKSTAANQARMAGT
jgi:hypothetical protein